MPKNPVELGWLSYQVAYVQVAQNGELTVVAENPNEVRIWDNLNATLKAGKDAWLNGGGKQLKFIGFYVHPNANVAADGGLHGRSYMLYTAVKPSYSATREIVASHRQRAPQNGVVY